ncbi:hypothetical protein GCK72_024767 [Caenorhabditis remanei]|uniref:Uncharacterized protein n=1 Tax=Caenorhabditis remanei TaxID=31234 RepID=A0A6A5G052_CAERE|nr:hypothetical protein GCK72_024767 [Caenorhabditis remanei]KAF1748300.1 hypothetical protein GCK72_024767 [Caenorhabditis remanei]
MSIDDVQRHITVVTLGSPAAYLFLRLLQKATVITHEPRNHTICWIFLSIYIMCTAASLTMCIAAFLHECDFEEYSYRRLIECCLRKNNERCPPEYQEAISTSALPPTYEEAIASRPPGYTPTSTPPVVSPSQSAVNITRNTVRYNCYQAEMEEAETMF